MKDSYGQSNPFGNRPMDGLKFVSRCPICQVEHSPSETAVLEELDGAHLIYIKCKSCGSGVVASLVPSQNGLASLGLVTDLSGYEIKSAKDWGRVNENDLLSVVGHFKTSKAWPVTL